MALTPYDIGKIYRTELANTLKAELGSCRFENSWLIFSNKKRFYTTYSKYHSDSDSYFYGVGKEVWQKWKETDHLVFLMPPEEFQSKIALAIKYIIMSSSESLALLKNCSQDQNDQKKIVIYRRRSEYKIHNYPFHHSNYSVRTLEVKPSSAKPEPLPGLGGGAKTVKNKGRSNSAKEGARIVKYGKYDSLLKHLNELSKNQVQVSFTFKQLNDIVGREIPPSSYEQGWWRSKLNKQLSGIGWKIDEIYLHGKKITLRRTVYDYLTNIKAYVRNLVEGSHNISLDIRTFMDWLQYCRRHWLYFEGTVLYEKAYRCDERLTETEQQEIEEHYQVCKRELNVRPPIIIETHEVKNE